MFLQIAYQRLKKYVTRKLKNYKLVVVYGVRIVPKNTLNFHLFLTNLIFLSEN